MQEFQLNNGLKILVKEDHRAAVVVSQLWYKVGGSYESPGITGISHALEHMMFRGTANNPGNQFSHIIAAQGGRENAQTSRDYTFYYEELTSDDLALAFELEADRMRHLLLDEADFDKEKQIILEERRLRVEDDPFALTYEKFAEKAFLNAYGNPVIGWAQDIEALTVEKLRTWFQQWYAPNNVTLVVVGDIQPQKVYQLAEKFFGHLQPSCLPAVYSETFKAPQQEQEITIALPAQLPWILMGYRTPSLATARPKWHAYALEVAAGILGSGHSSRFNKHIVRERQLATEADASYDLYDRLEGLFLISAIPETLAIAPQLKAAFLEQINQLQTQLVHENELRRVKNQVMARQIYKKDSMFGEAQELGLLEAIGLSWDLAEQYAPAILAVTPEQIQFVAKQYLQPHQLTTAILEPRRLSYAPAKGI